MGELLIILEERGKETEATVCQSTKKKYFCVDNNIL